MVDRARKKKRPEQQPRPDCSVAQLMLGTPLPLLAAPLERPEKFDTLRPPLAPVRSNAIAVPKSAWRGSSAISSAGSNAAAIGYWYAQRGSAIQRRIARSSNSMKIDRFFALQLMVCRPLRNTDSRPELVRCNGAPHYDCALRQGGLQRQSHASRTPLAHRAPVTAHHPDR